MVLLQTNALYLSKGTHQITPAHLDGLDQSRSHVLFFENNSEVQHTKVTPARYIFSKWVLSGFDTAVLGRTIDGRAALIGAIDHQAASGNSQVLPETSGDNITYSGSTLTLSGSDNGTFRDLSDSEIKQSSLNFTTAKLFVRLISTRSVAGTTKIKRLKFFWELLLPDGITIYEYQFDKTKTFTFDVLVA